MKNIQLLQQPYTSIDICKKTFDHNIDAIKQASESPLLAFVIKSNGYGHGLSEAVALAEDNKQINWLCTAHLTEAVAARKFGATKPILVMSCLDGPLEVIPKYDITCTINSLHEAEILATLGAQSNSKIRIHIKIDTGMGRYGIMHEQALEIIKKITTLKHIIIDGIYTHLADSSNPESKYSTYQLNRFDTLLDQLMLAGIDIPHTHAVSSSGLHIAHNTQYSLLRAGGLCYGLIKTAHHYAAIQKKHPSFSVRPIMRWKSYISNIKQIPANWPVGYHCSYYTQKPTSIATIPVGYSDGYPRQLSNNGHVIIDLNEKQIIAPIIGIVSMNVITVDVSDIPALELNTPVYLLGTEHPIRPDTCAKKAGIITNQLMTQIQQNITRTIM